MENSDIQSDVAETNTISVLHANELEQMVDATQKKTSAVVLRENTPNTTHGNSWATFAVLVSSFFATEQLWKKAELEALGNLQNIFVAQTQKSVDEIEKHMTLMRHLLIHLDSFFAHNPTLNEGGYWRYLRSLSLGKNYPSIQSVSFLPEVSEEEIGRYSSSSIQQESILAFDYDVTSDVVIHRDAIDIMKKDGELVRVVQRFGNSIMPGKYSSAMHLEHEEMTRYTMFHPVNKSAFEKEGGEKVGTKTIGLVSLVFHMEKLMESIDLDPLSRFHIEIHESTQDGRKKCIYKSSSEKVSHPLFQDSRILSVGRNVWTLSISSLPGFDEELDSKKTEITAIVGGVTSILLTLLVRMLIQRHIQVTLTAENEHSINERLKTVLHGLSHYTESINKHAIISITDIDGRIVEANEQFYKTTQYTRDEVVGKTHRIFKSGVHSEEFYKELWETITSGEVWRNEVCNRKKDGSLYWVDVSIVPMKNTQKEIIGYIAIRVDISKHKESERNLIESASHDALTGLPNRTLMLDRLNQAIIQSHRNGKEGAVLFIDLDRFKTINDTFGHDAGDFLLKSVAERMRHVVRQEDTIARQGGDEFIVILTEMAHSKDAEIIAKKLVDTLSMPYTIHGQSLSIGASIGISVFPKDGSHLETLIKQSDIAMYQAKKNGNGYQFFE